MLASAIMERGCVYGPTEMMEFKFDRQRSCCQRTFVIFVFQAHGRSNLPSPLICQKFMLVCQASPYFFSNVTLSTPLFCLYKYFHLAGYLSTKMRLRFAPHLKCLLTVVFRVRVLFRLTGLLLWVLIIQPMVQDSQRLLQLV
jgi:hypothetical protein